ncbi:hypothetical protein V3470_06040 [Flavobacterium oreochromis]|uniref:DUF2079 domain-containing protein n=1 Tax=Flavobacterium oreochromis TaxID=2906078 RepID=A0ABW8P8E9_9FLAO|nr:hypothetical protein [Flavobacterium oreochromis]OWP76049.1 hypothetical protein BWG23_09125 [Flavobacterium oreochromis]
MKKINCVPIGFIVFFNLIIASGFYWQQQEATVLELSSDLANIIPICKKIDDPSLFSKDLFLEDLKDVKYYTPFYVQTLRFIAKTVNHDYIKALNILGFITHFIFGLFWYLAFAKMYRLPWIAFFMSILVRGIVWPPGGELLGISELWTIMPRTLFQAILPVPFIIYIYTKKNKLLLASLSLGFISNFHPISGIGAFTLYWAAYVSYSFLENNNSIKKILYESVLISTFFTIGILPFIINYFSNIENVINIDRQFFNHAFLTRIPETFINPLKFIIQWNRNVFWFFLLSFLLFIFLDRSFKKKISKILFFAMIVLFLVSNSIFYIECFINEVLDTNLRMAFQFIRFQKFLLILLEISLGFLLIELIQRMKLKSYYSIIIVFIFLFLLVFSHTSLISRLPLIGDDLGKSILPKIFMVNAEYRNSNKSDLNTIIEYIKKNTSKNELIYGHFLVRAGANRSVCLDGKGAGMLIEGNPIKFINWYTEYDQFNKLNVQEQLRFLKQKGVKYIVSKEKYSLEILKETDTYKLYKL